MIKTQAPARRYVDALEDVLRIYSNCRETICVEAITLHGVGRSQAVIPHPYALPLPVLKLLEDDFSLRIYPATRTAGNQPHELPMLFARWRPEASFTAHRQRPYRVAPEAQAAIAAALATMPVPTVLIDGAHEVWAAWRLEDPIDLLRDRARAEELQRALTSLVGAEADAATALDGMLPFAGVVRNWNNPANARPEEREWIQVVQAVPERIYRIQDLGIPEED